VINNHTEIVNRLRFFVASAILPLLLGCESIPPVELQPVGPLPLSKTEQASMGYLKVYSAIEMFCEGDRCYEEGDTTDTQLTMFTTRTANSSRESRTPPVLAIGTHS
jgi:hypothetical protein